MTITGELATYLGLVEMKLPELGSKRIIDVSRMELIGSLEAKLARHQSDTIHLSKRKLHLIEHCLNTAYLHLDGVLDDVPVRIACAPRVIQTVEPDMFEQFLDKQPWEATASWGRSLNETLIQRFLAEWTYLQWWELVVGFGVGILLIPRGANDGYDRHYFRLPEWIQPIEEAIRKSYRPPTVGDLYALVPSTS